MNISVFFYNCSFVPPPPPPIIKGPIPSKRLETQIPAEAPACVQNAMMTKDKKPFTYTPGGIDLSQIKSPRMAKRVQKNALSEGVTGPPKMSPLAQPNKTQQPTPPPMCMAKDMTGMPFQVFPTGPPPPPPMPIKQQQQKQTEIETQNGTRKKSPQPSQQHFEPPPIGFRPEIKIPQNPMANLKPTPRPQQNDDFWIEEYKSDKAAEPVLGSAPVTSPTKLHKPEPELAAKQESLKHTSFHDKKVYQLMLTPTGTKIQTHMTLVVAIGKMFYDPRYSRNFGSPTIAALKRINFLEIFLKKSTKNLNFLHSRHRKMLPVRSKFFKIAIFS